MASYRTVTFEELRVRNKWDPRRHHAPGDGVMLVANELAANAMRNISESIRTVAERNGITSGGHRKRASDYSRFILAIHRSEAPEPLNADDLSGLIMPVMTAEAASQFLPPFQINAPPELLATHTDPTPVEEALAAAVESGEVADADAAAAKLEALAFEPPPGKSTTAPAAEQESTSVATAVLGSSPSKELAGTASSSSWTDLDVEVSRAGTDDPDALRVGGERKKRNVVRDLGTSIADFWTQHSVTFSSFWRSLPADQRQNLLLSVAPHMPASRGYPWSLHGEDVHGAVALMPELNVHDLVHGGEALIELFQSRAKATPEDLQHLDLTVIRQSIQRRLLPGRASQATRKVYPPESMYEGEPFEFRPGPEHAQLMEWLKQGLFVDAFEFEPMLHRQENILMTLTLVADEYRTEYLTEHLKTGLVADRS